MPGSSPLTSRLAAAALALLLVGGVPAGAEPATAGDARQGSPAAAQAGVSGGGGGETVQQALCRLITRAAEDQHLPVPFLTRLIWQESSFRADVTSPAGAQGVAQFMPGTAAERGLDDPFDPEKAVPASAALLAELSGRFGNLGLAAAAYNAGPGREVARRAGLPSARDRGLRRARHGAQRRRLGGRRQGRPGA